MTPTETPDRTKRFVVYLQEFAARGASSDRAALAALRRGLGKAPGEAPEMFPYLVPWTGDMPGHSEKAYYLVASLFALHPESWSPPDGEERRDRWRRNFGSSMRRAALEELQRSDEIRGSSTERRFVALLNANEDDVGDHLRHAVSLCASRDVPVAWDALLNDLLRWSSTTHWVQRDWARGFWYEPPRPNDEANESSQDE